MKRFSMVLVSISLCSLVGCGAGPQEGDENSAEDVAQARSALEPCGEQTVASVLDADGRRLGFCVSASGREIVIENLPDGVPSVLADYKAKVSTASVPGSALEVFLLNTAADLAVPQALVDSAARHGRSVALNQRITANTRVIQPEPVAQPTLRAQSGGVVLLSTSSKYCNPTTGPTDFWDDFCKNACNGSADCISACTPQYWGSSYRWCSESDFAHETIASCSGQTHLIADTRDDSSSPWETPVLDTWIPKNHTVRAWVNDGPSSWSDSDLRFRATSASGASHMHLFECWDT